MNQFNSDSVLDSGRACLVLFSNWTAPVLAETERFCNPKRKRGIVLNSFPRLHFGLLFWKEWRCPTKHELVDAFSDKIRCFIFPWSTDSVQRRAAEKNLYVARPEMRPSGGAASALRCLVFVPAS